MPKTPYKLISPQAGRHSEVCENGYMSPENHEKLHKWDRVWRLHVHILKNAAKNNDNILTSD